MPRRAWILLPVLILLALLVWGATAYVRSSRPSTGQVAGSGTIEADQVSIASKIPGRIERIHAAEGQVVRAGEALVTIEGRELLAQIDQAAAAVDAARARVDQAQAALALQIRQVEAQAAQAQAALEGARVREQQVREAQRVTSSQGVLAVRQTEAALAGARENSNVAKANLDRASQDLARVESLFKDGAVSGQQLDAARTTLASARAQYEASLEVVRQVEIGVRLARENLRQVEIRERDVAAAQSQVEQAAAGLRLARAGEELIVQRRADVATAQAQVRQAEANLRSLRTQQQNLVITAPTGGVVISRHASEGEIVGAGAPILTVADLAEVWIRVFIPLPDLGLVALGQRAEITTDALQDGVFTGTVTEISQEAEFTPRNVQTRQERVKTVFAVKVSLQNPGGALKPGMPADAVIFTR